MSDQASAHPQPPALPERNFPGPLARTSSRRAHSPTVHAPGILRERPARLAGVAAMLVLGLLSARLRADEVRIQNGDHYAGNVLSLTTNTLVLQSAALGKTTLARRQVVAIVLTPEATPHPAARSTDAPLEDEVWMRNGDRVAGRVLTLNTNCLILQSSVLGKVTLPRVEVGSITLAALATNKPAALPTTVNPGSAAAGQPGYRVGEVPPLDLNNAAIGDIKQRYLSQAGPEATKQFNDMLAGLLSGKLSVDDIRAQAQSVAAQVRALKRDMGNEPGAEAIDGYLEILDQFLQQSAPAAPAKSAGKQP